MYIAPLRHAILHLAARGVPFTVAAVAQLGTASPLAARRYVHLLADKGIVLVTVDHRIVVARNYDEWAATIPKTKPGGHRKITYRAVPREAPCPL